MSVSRFPNSLNRWVTWYDNSNINFSAAASAQNMTFANVYGDTGLVTKASGDIFNLTPGHWLIQYMLFSDSGYASALFAAVAFRSGTGAWQYWWESRSQVCGATGYGGAGSIRNNGQMFLPVNTYDIQVVCYATSTGVTSYGRTVGERTISFVKLY